MKKWWWWLVLPFNLEFLALLFLLVSGQMRVVNQQVALATEMATATLPVEIPPTKLAVSVGHIAWANEIADINYISIGQKLKIPDPNQAIGGVNLKDKQIVVVLFLQRVYAYEEGKQIREFVVSTGLPKTPTVLGKYSVYLKYPLARMRGDGYDLKDVPWTMYFYGDYGIHGTYWHSNFGVPMSHGCVNMETSDAEWLYNWSPMGTKVWVQP